MIIINARFLTQPISGVQRYAIELSKELMKSSLDVEFVSPKNIVHVELAKELKVKIIGGAFLKGHLWEQIALRYYAIKNRSLLISFCNTAPVFLKNQIVTIHDLAFRVKPEWFSRTFALAYNIIIPIIAKNSKLIITVSNTSKEEIINELNITSKKVKVVYNAVSPIFLGRPQNINTKDYILTVSSHNPRKNFINLVEAFKLIPDKNLELYVVGNFNKHFSAVNVDKELNMRIKFLHNITDKELAVLYQEAKLFVYPSIYEGFGIPIIEAMSQNTPVCVSDIKVFREICPDNCTYFDPHDIDDIKNKMNLALNNRSKIDYDLTKYNWNTSFKKLEKYILAAIDKEKNEKSISS